MKHIWTKNRKINIGIKGCNYCYPDLEAVESAPVTTKLTTLTMIIPQTIEVAATTTKPVKKKKTISSTIKKLVWNINIGEEIGKSKSTDITQMSFNCGHVIAEANGGETIVSNLKPICQKWGQKI
jgi:hypothetical protein